MLPHLNSLDGVAFWLAEMNICLKTSLRWQFDEFEVDIRDSSHCHDEVYIFTDTETKGPFCGFDDAFANPDRPVS